MNVNFTVPKQYCPNSRYIGKLLRKNGINYYSYSIFPTLVDNNTTENNEPKKALKDIVIVVSCPSKYERKALKALSKAFPSEDK